MGPIQWIIQIWFFVILTILHPFQYLENLCHINICRVFSRQPHTYIQTNKHTHMCVCIVTKHFLRCPKLLNTHQHIFFHIRRVRQLRSSKEQQQQQDHICAICGRPAKTSIFKQKVGDTYYIVDKDECATLLKRFHSVYGNDFCLMFKEQ